MTKREYKRSTRFSTYKNYEKEELNDLIEIIKKTGLIPSGKYVSANQIEPYLKEVYFEAIKSRNNGCTKYEIDKHTMDFINLSQPIQLSLIKKFQVGDSYEELQSLVALKLMEIIFDDTYNPEKASLTSQIYENVYQVLLKNFKDEKEYEKTQISLIDLDGKMNSLE